MSFLKKLALPIQNKDEGKRGEGNRKTQEQMRRYGDPEVGRIRVRAES